MLMIIDEIKSRLNSLEAARTTLRLVAQIYKPGSWTGVPKDPQQDVEEEWSLRSIVSGWGWRLVSELRNIKDEGVIRLKGFHFNLLMVSSGANIFH